MIESVGLAFCVAQTIFAAMQCKELKDLFGCDLDGLGRSLETIQAVLLDADSKQAHGIELSAQERNFIDQIKDVVYDADDVLDGYVTRARQQQINKESSQKRSAKVRGLCSRLKHLAIYSHKVIKIAKNLENIGRNAQNFKVDPTPIRRIREETCSYVTENDIVGREDDQRTIVDMLLQPIVQGELPVLTIVGVGGLGKTALAQLVYKDPKIQNEFSLRLWVCVSDEGGNKFDVKAILAHIYKSATDQSGDMELDLLVHKLRSTLNQHKYFIVLDDLWNEKRDECHKLVGFLRESVESGSRIVVTTRSKKTAEAIGSSQTYELHGLSDENSWDLFEKRVGREIKEGHPLFEIGKDIVKKCVNVPLAIKVIGSLLYGADENEWLSFQQSKLFDIKKDDNGIMQILKLSYFHLSPSLKSCFTYCAIFPKDFEISKDELISMWMAHDYVKDEAQAEEHFKILWQRSFFQDMKEKSYGEIEFKIHDLMHDMAQEVAGKEIYIANSATTELDKKTRHLNDGARGTRTNDFVTPAKIRSYVHIFSDSNDISNIHFPVSAMLAKWKYLRVLDLHALGIIELPEEIGDLLHLRYLDLSGNEELKMLPEALTKLINLRFLKLGNLGIRQLPKAIGDLLHLRYLDLFGNKELRMLPEALTKLINLQFLNLGYLNVIELPESIGDMVHLRFLDLSGNEELRILPEALTKLINLQFLNLGNLGIIELPESIGDMLHLRYLDLSGNEELKMLPEALTKLINLHFLYLDVRWELKELPRDLKKLVNLRILYVPFGMEKMTHLGRVNRFIVNHRQSGLKQEDMLEVFRCLKNLMGSLVIEIKGDYKDATEHHGKGRYICKTQHLHSIRIEWEIERNEEVRVGNDEYLLEALQPHRNLKKLEIWWYNGVRIPSWAREESLTTTLPNIVEIWLVCCNGLDKLPCLGRLQHLKALSLFGLKNVEYIENRRSIGDESSSRDDGGVASNSSTILFFPSLEQLELYSLPKLKGWWSRTPAHPLPSFPSLSQLKISKCPNLKSIPLCTSVKTLSLIGESYRSGNVVEQSRRPFTKDLAMAGFQCLVNLTIKDDNEVESLSEFEEMLRNCSSTLTSLRLEDCRKLRSVSEGGGLEYLTVLQVLWLFHLPELEFEEREEKEEMPWRSLAQSLYSLTLFSLFKVDKLPKGMRYLTSLISLFIYSLPLLKEIPEWIGCLFSLQSITINSCKSLETLPRALKNLTSLNKFELLNCNAELKRRCEKPDGEYWPILQHIPKLTIQEE